MIDLIVVCEGQTEQSFVGDVLAVFLADQGRVLIDPRIVSTSRRGKGGALTADRIMRYLRNTLRERGDTYVTTLFDLYGLVADFPGRGEAERLGDPIERAVAIEATFHEAVVRKTECRRERFIPHIQPYEFESLLFSDVDRFAEVEPAWQASIEDLQEARDSAASPEHINDGRNTHPSNRLRTLLRGKKYQKVLHGKALSARIGVERMRAECRHFGAWLERIERLAPLRRTE